MPTYSFICGKCDHNWETFQNMSSYSQPEKCPECKSVKVNRNYQADLPVGSVIKSDAEISVGQLADRNRERFSEDQKETLYRKHNEYKAESLKRKTYKITKKNNRKAQPRSKKT